MCGTPLLVIKSGAVFKRTIKNERRGKGGEIKGGLKSNRIINDNLGALKACFDLKNPDIPESIGR